MINPELPNDRLDRRASLTALSVGVGLSSARGVAMIGNQFSMTHERPPVTLGEIRAMSAMGIYSNRKLFDRTRTREGRVSSTGDYAEQCVFAMPTAGK